MKIKFGDLIEIPTKKGFAYAQYTNETELHGSVIRVFDELHSERPVDPAKLVRGTVRFSTFFPVSASVKYKLVHRVGNFEIAPENRALPIFRYGIPPPGTCRVEEWFRWDGNSYEKIETMTPEERKLPILSILDVVSLTDRIEEGWRPENDPR